MRDEGGRDKRFEAAVPGQDELPQRCICGRHDNADSVALPSPVGEAGLVKKLQPAPSLRALVGGPSLVEGAHVAVDQSKILLTLILFL